MAIASVVPAASYAQGERPEAAGSDEPEGEVIEVEGEAPEESQPLEYTLSADDVRTTPGALGDALRAIAVLPAAARIPYSFGGLVLRGMSPRDSSVFVDGVEIPIAFHFGGITAVYPTPLLDELKVIPSGFDVSYGRTQGGVIELVTRTPRRDRWRWGAEASLLHTSGSIEGPIWGDGAFVAGLRRSYLDVLARPIAGPEATLPSYSDGQLRATWGNVATGQLTAYALASLDHLSNSEDAARPPSLTEPARSHISVYLGFVRSGLRYRRSLGDAVVTVDPFVGTNTLSAYELGFDEEGVRQTQDVARRWVQFGTRADWLRDDPGGFLRAGIDVAGGYLGRASGTATSDGVDEDFPVPPNTVLWADAALWAEARRHFWGGRLSVRPGLRLEKLGLGRDWVLDPRVSAHADLSPSSVLRASLGRYHQPPSPAHFDEFTDNVNASSSYVDQATLGVEWTPAPDLRGSATAFWHEGRDTLVDVANEFTNPQLGEELTVRELLEEQLGFYGYQDNIGRQRSYGVEFAVRYDTPGYRLVANYAWARALRQYAPPNHRWQPYGLDQPQRLNLLAATRAGKWNFGVRLAIVTGNPIELIPKGTPGSEGEEAKVLLRLPTFWQLDVRVDRAWKRKWGTARLFLDVQNATYNRNVESRSNRLADDLSQWEYEDAPGLPILPFLGVEFTSP